MFNKMKTFNMYVKTFILNERNKVLLLREKRMDKKPLWDLPGSKFTEEQSFDESVITNVQKEIGYYVYPGKIIGTSDYSDKDTKEVNIIMEGTILNGELRLSDKYEAYTWIETERINEYPLVPWFNQYIQKNKHPFEDVQMEIDDYNERKNRRIEVTREDLRSSIHDTPSQNNQLNDGIKSSFGLLKDTIIKTFHPREAKITRTEPKSNELYNKQSKKSKNSKITDKFNFSLKKNKKEEESSIKRKIQETINGTNSNDIIIEHENGPKSNIPKENKTEKAKTRFSKVTKTIKKESKTKNKAKKIFDMNVNRTQNMKEPVRTPEIKIIRKNEETPHIRKEKESRERVSFDSESVKSGWKDRLNRINRTDANNTKKEAPRPKGRRK